MLRISVLKFLKGQVKHNLNNGEKRHYVAKDGK